MAKPSSGGAALAGSGVSLRDYQKRGIQDIRAAFGRGVQRVLYTAPTGSGKTTLFTYITRGAAQKGNRVVILVHRRFLVDQVAGALNEQGVPHGIIMGGHSLTDAQVQVASVQTVVARLEKLPEPGLIVIDECFPAGTPVDGIPIEAIRRGDVVRSFNHQRGTIERAQVTRTFRSKPSALVTVHLRSGRRLVCTPNHPFFSEKGYVPARNLAAGTRCYVARNRILARGHEDDSGYDLRMLRGASGGAHPQPESTSEERACLLQRSLPRQSRFGQLLVENVADEPHVRIPADDATKPDEKPGYSGESATVATSDRAQARSPGRQRTRLDGPAGGATRSRSELDARIRGGDAYGATQRLPGALQDRLGARTDQAGNRDRRVQSREFGTPGKGPEEGSVLDVDWVDGVEVHEPGSDGRFGGRLPDGCVYNIEVEGNHNYFAGDVLVHNCHHAVAQQWKTILDHWPRAKVLGVTATPERLDGKGLGDVFGDLVHGPSVQELIDKGWLAPFDLYAPPEKIDLSQIKTERGDFRKGDLEAATDQKAVTGDAVEHYRQHLNGRPAIAFCVTVDHARHVAELFRAAGFRADHVDGSMNTVERNKRVDGLRTGQIQVLTSCDLVSEGFDVPATAGAILLRPTKSRQLYCLDMETEILTSHGWKGPADVSIGDVALCRDMDTGKGCWSRVTGTIERQMSNDEAWIQYDAPRANFRVTDQHRLIYATETSSGWSEWLLRTAGEVQTRKSSIRMPTAVHIDQPGVPLNDNELYLIGIIITDGSVTVQKVTIHQSERYPEVMRRIERALDGAGIFYKKKRHNPQTEYQENFPRWTYNISAGEPRCGHEGKGIRYLYPYLDKDFSPLLMSLSRSQFGVLLDAIWDGDGTKKANVDYTPRSKKIVTARKVAADRLQALGVMNGYTVHLRWEHGPRSNPIAALTFSDRPWRSVAGSGVAPRPRIERRPATKERVWCVETEADTIVTRRRGKVTVMGNCQQVGRALRPKSDGGRAVILDHVGNSHRHGLPSTPIEWTLEGSKGKQAPALTTCKTCYAVFSPDEKPSVALECPDQQGEDCPMLAPASEGGGGGREMPQQQAGQLEKLDEEPAWAAGINIRTAGKEEITWLVENAETIGQLKHIQKIRGYKPGWLYYKLRARGWLSEKRKEAAE